MKNIYVFIAVTALYMMGVELNAQYYSNTGTYDYSESAAWSGTQPPASGDLTSMVYVTSGSEVTKSEVGSGDDIDAQGSYRYSGVRYSGMVYGTFIIEGNLDVTGDKFSIFSGGTVIVYGNLYASEEIDVANGGTLIVYGNLTTGQLNGGRINDFAGDIIVAGDVDVKSVDLESTANLVVGGDLYYDADFDLYGDLYVTDDEASVGGTGWFDEAADVGDATDLSNDGDYADLEDILISVGMISAVDAPTNFTFDNLSGTSADLSWTLNTDNDDVIIALYSSDSSGSPEDATSYVVGNTLSDGAEIIFVGSAQEVSTTYALFTEGATNYVRIWSVNNSVEYSTAIKLSVKALSSADLLYEDFENGAASSGSYTGDTHSWTLGADGTGGTRAEWVVGSGDAYVGSSSAYVSTDNGSTVGYNTSNTADINLGVSVTIPSTYKSAELTFYWKATGEVGYDGGAVEVDGSNVIDAKSLYGQDVWVEKVVDLTDEIGNTVDIDFNWYNDGSDGSSPGLCIDEVRVTGSDVAKPESFTAVASSSDEIVLAWDKSLDNDDVIVAYSSSGTIGRPESGTDYTEGDYLSGGGRVIYVGSDTGYTHTGSFSGALTYSIWSQKSSAYSSALTADVQVPVSLPFEDDFESETDSWSFNSSGYLDEWVVGSAEAYEGSSSVYISIDKGINANYNEDYALGYLELEVDLRDYATAELTFWWKGDGSNRAYGSVLIDDTNVGSSYYDNTTWTEETIDLSSYVGDLKTLKFRWYNNNQNGSPSLCIDNVYITGTIADPNSFTATNSNTLYNDLAWELNDYDDEVVVARSTDGVFGTPVEGETYEEGDEIVGGGTIMFIGSDELTDTHSPLNYGTIYYYKAWSSRNGIYSAGITSNANTPNKVTVLTEDWEDNSDGYPEWSIVNANETTWLLGGTDQISSGTYAAYVSRDGSTAAYRRNRNRTASLEVTINLDDLQSATLSFDWMSDGENGSDYGEVYLNGSLLSASEEYEGNSSWLSESLSLDAYCDNGLGDISLSFYWSNNNNGSGTFPGFCIDNVEIGGIYAATSLVDNSSAPSTEINSLVNSSASAVSVFQFDLTDKTSLYNDITRVQQLVISKGAVNEIDDWSDALGGALLFGPDLDVAGMTGTITSASITFTDTDMILLETQDSPETYYLKVWLNTDLNEVGVSDGDVFDFAIESNNMVTGLGDDFVVDQMEESGIVTIDVDATALSFTQQPSEYATVDYLLTQVPEVSAVDANGNVDLDFTNTVTLTNSGALVMTNASVSAVAGVASFSSLTFTEVGTVTLDGGYSGWSTGDSDEITIQDYCIPSHTGVSRYINNVILSTLSNTSGDDSGYGSYVDQSLELTIGVDYDIDLGIYQASGTGYAYVWIDWDQSGTFDSDEKLSVGSSSSTGSVVALSGTLTVPDDQDATAGATRMRVQFSQDSNLSDACGGSSGESEDYIVVLSTNGWLGSNNQWDIAQNWTSGSVPDSGSDVYIPENPYYNLIFPLIDGTAAMNDLEIASNASLTISAGSQVDIYGDVITNDGLVIENTIADPTTLITHKDGVSVSGNANVQWPLTEMVWWYIGHSVSGVSEADYDNSFGVADYALNIYDSGWDRVSGIGDVYTGDYPFSSPLEGYSMVLRNSGQTLSYNGVLNADASYSDTYSSGLHLIANPYPAYVDVMDVDFTLVDFAQTVYIRRSDNLVSSYNLLVGDLSSTNEGSRYIAPGQCMWIRAVADNATVTFSKDTRTHTNGGYGLKGATTSSDEVLKLSLESNYGTDESVIIFNENGSELYTAYDSEKVMNSGVKANLFSVKDDRDLVVNSMPELSADYTVALGYQVAQSGMSDITIEVTNITDFMPEVDVYLEDKEDGVILNLREESSYTFTPSVTATSDRFSLVFDAVEPISTDIDEESVVSEENVMIYAINKKVTVRVTQELLQYSNRIVEVYDLVGKLIAEYELDDLETKFELPRTNTVYIIKVSVDNYSYQEKVIGLN